MNFVARAREIVRAAGLPVLPPSELVERWRSFVAECQSGYQWDYSEYQHEIRVRDSLEAIFRTSELQTAPEVQALFNEVHTIDDKFRVLLLKDEKNPSGKQWWDAGILKSAGPPYAEFVLKAFGVRVAII